MVNLVNLVILVNLPILVNPVIFIFSSDDSGDLMIFVIQVKFAFKFYISVKLVFLVNMVI